MNHFSYSLEKFWIQDLYWLLYSPPLHHNTPAHIFTASQWEQWNLLLCQHYSPQHIQDLDHYFINHHSHRLLGKYTENLFLWWLKQPFTDEIYGWKLYQHEAVPQNHNIVIYQTINGKKGDEKITIGELDFLISVDNSVIYHLELAVKFYLYIPQLHEAYGLGLNDTWSRKNQQIEKTFALGQEYFKGFKDLQYFQSLLWIKGVIHYPKYQVKNKVNNGLNNGLNNECPLLKNLHHEHQQGTYELSNIATEKIRQQHGIIDFAINNEKIAPRLQTRAKLHLEVNQSWIDLALMQHH